MSHIAMAQPNGAQKLFSTSDQIHDYSPTMSYAGDKLIFQSNRNGGYLLFESTKTSANWSEPQALEDINQHFSRYNLVGGPCLNKDGNKLYLSGFRSDGEGDMDIYISTLENGRWSIPEILDRQINTEDFEGFPSISPDGQTLYFVRRYLSDKNEDPNCSHIFYSKQVNNKWSKAKELILDSPYNCPEGPTVLYGNKALIFSQKQNNNLNLYKLILKTDSTESKIIPWDFANSTSDEHYLTINGEGDQIIFNSGNSLYQMEVPLEYRTEAYLTINGQVLDAELKTPVEAVYQLQSEDGSVSYYGSVPVKKRTNNLKVSLKSGKKYSLTISHPLFQDTVYSYDLTDLKEFKKQETTFYLNPKRKEVVLNITDAESNEKLSVKISIGNLDLDEEISLDQIVKRDGKYVVSLREGNNYNIEISSQEGYAYSKTNYSVPITKSDKSSEILNNTNGEMDSEASQMFARLDSILSLTTDEIVVTNPNTPEINRSIETPIDIKVIPLKVGTQLELKDIYFDFSSSKLKEESFVELKKVQQLMAENPKLTIEIGAHTDNVGSKSFNYNLSLKRAKSIVDFLISLDVDKDRLISKGYGFSKPIASNDTEEGRAKNRRVELTIKK